MTASSLRGVVAALMMTIAAAPTAAQSFAQVDQAVQDGIREGLYPGAVVVIGRRDSILYSRGYGHFTWNPASRVPDADSTLWDIASITKVVATASSAMRLVDRGKLDLDARVGRYLPALLRRPQEPGDRAHAAGPHQRPQELRADLPARRPEPPRMIDLLYAQPLVRAPGDSAEYSDLNAMLLGLVVEKVSRTTARPLRRRARSSAPSAWSRPDVRPPVRLKRRTVPSGHLAGAAGAGRRERRERRRVRRGGGARGRVLDRRRTSRGSLRSWLRDGDGPQGPLGQPRHHAAVPHHGPRSGTRLLGWDSPELNGEEPSIFGTLISQSAYGHTGLTGTELWIDPTHDLFLVFLTNRAFDPQGPGLAQGAEGACGPSCRTRLSGWCRQSCAQELVSRC